MTVPVPPTIPQRLSQSTECIDTVRRFVNEIVRDLPDDAPMFPIVDIVNALWNLRNASVLLDKAADTLEADTPAVTR